MSSPSLPPLPGPWQRSTLTQRHAPAKPDLFSTDQMRAYGEACAAAEREACAILAENTEEYDHPEGGITYGERSAAAIRARGEASD